MKVKGWKNVFSFTLVQQIKTKSFIISTVIISLVIALIAVTANILPLVLMEGEIKKLENTLNGEAPEISLSKVYISDETDIGFAFPNTVPELGAVEFVSIPPENADAKEEEFKESMEREMLVRLLKTEEGALEVRSCYAANNAAINKDDCAAVNSLMAAQLKAQYLSHAGVPAEELPTAMSDVNTVLTKAGEEESRFIKDMINSVVPMVGSLVLFIFIFAYSSMIAQAVATEKSSRVMEYLLTSVSPLSIIIGKVLAICLVSLMQFLILGIAGTAGFMIAMPFGIFGKIDSLAAAASGSGIVSEARGIIDDIGEVFSGVGIDALIVILLTFVLGFLLYALIAGLAGASISKMEDLSSAVQPMSIVGVLGFYLAYMPQVTAVEGESNIFMVAARYIPISSPFCLPSAYMLGQIGLGETLIALAVLLVCVVVMCVIVAKVYEHIVLYTGNRLKLSDMLKMAKTNK